MPPQNAKPAAVLLLMLNLFLYFIVTVLAAWAVNHAIDHSYEAASQLPLSARIFPIYFPMGNMATGLFVIVSLLAGVVGVTTSLTGFNNMRRGYEPDVSTASASSLAAWALTMLALGCASKEIQLGYPGSIMRAMEMVIVVLSITQLLFAIGITRAMYYYRNWT